MAQKGVNKVILIGNVGGDPEIRYLPNGNAVANVTLATSDSWKDKQTGQQQERTEWHRVVFFGRIAEIVGEYVKKGSKLYIEGRLQTREWEKDGVKRYTTEIVVDQGGSMQLLDSNRNGNGGQAGGNQGGGGGNNQGNNGGYQGDSNQSNYQQRPQGNQQQRPQGNQQQRPQGNQQQRPAPQQQQPPIPDYDSFDDDIPF